MRVLHLVSSSARRGAETFAVNLSSELAARGIESSVLALVEAGKGDSLRIPVLGTKRRSPRSLLRLRAAARSADVLIAHGSVTLEASAVALSGSGTPFIYRTIGDPSYWVRGTWRPRAIGVLQRQATRHVALWAGAAEQLAERYRIPSEFIDVIPNAVPESQFPEATAALRDSYRQHFGVRVGMPCFGYVGSLSPEKNVAAAVHAVGRMPDARLLIAGDGPQRNTLEELSSRVAPGRVHFLGTLKDPYQVYAASDLLLLPSLSEGMPAVVVEAALVGVATVATRVGSIPEMIDYGKTGWIVPAGDSESFADVLRAAVAEAPRVGRAARKAFRSRYSLSLVAGQWEQTILRTTSSDVP